MQNFKGDMTEGFREVMRMFSEEADLLLSTADAESELLYAVFMVLVSVPTLLASNMFVLCASEAWVIPQALTETRVVLSVCG